MAMLMMPCRLNALWNVGGVWWEINLKLPRDAQCMQWCTAVWDMWGRSMQISGQLPPKSIKTSLCSLRSGISGTDSLPSGARSVARCKLQSSAPVPQGRVWARGCWFCSTEPLSAM